MCVSIMHHQYSSCGDDSHPEHATTKLGYAFSIDDHQEIIIGASAYSRLRFLDKFFAVSTQRHSSGEEGQLSLR